MFGSTESEMVGLISREIIFAVFNLYDYDTSTSQSDTQTPEPVVKALETGLKS